MKVGAAALAGLLAVLVSTTAAAEAPPRDLDELRAAIAAILQHEQVPGAGIALVDGGQIVWSGGVGVADRATGRPVTADTLFRACSITKSVVLTLAFAIGSIGSMVQALAWLPRPGSGTGKLYRLGFALAACCATAYLAAYGIIGIRLGSY